MKPLLFLAASSLFVANASHLAEPAAPPPAGNQTFGAESSLVLLDLVVRDKKGRPVTDLTEGEITILEDGAPCPIRSLRFVGSDSSEPAAPTPSATPAGPTTPAQGTIPNLVTLVFDRFGPEGAGPARQAARAWAEKGFGPKTRVAVFKLGTRLHLLQPLTSDPAAIARAVDAATGPSESLSKVLAAQAQAAQTRVNAIRPATTMDRTGPRPYQAPAAGDASVRSGTDSSAAGNERSGADQFEYYAARAEASALQMSAELQRRMDGQSQLWPLIALFESQAALPGRKTVILFSPGLVVPADLDSVFRTAIGQANKANVSVYAVDTRGLAVERQLEASARMATDAALSNMEQVTRDSSAGITREEMQTFDRSEDALRLDTAGVLRNLAEDTGGFLVADTNDIAPRLDRVLSDTSAYYSLSYAPTRTTFDGSFRRIKVAVARKDVVVQARSGYFAMPPGAGLVLPWEAPLLAALAAPAPPRDFAQRFGLLQFALTPEGRETTLVVEVPLEPFNFVADKKTKLHSLHLSVLALVRDPEGRVVGRAGDDFPMAVPAEKLAEIRKSSAVLRRTLSLVPGEYRLEVAARTREGRTSITKSSFDVPDLPEGLGISSLVLVRRTETALGDSADPLRVGDLRVIPNLDVPLSRSQSVQPTIFFQVYPVAGEPPKLELEIVQGKTVLSTSRPALPPVDEEGIIRAAVPLPLASAPNGRYDVRVRVTQGDDSAEEETPVEIVP